MSKILKIGDVELTNENPVLPAVVTVMEANGFRPATQRGVWSNAVAAHPDTGKPVGVRVDHSKPEYRPHGKYTGFDSDMNALPDDVLARVSCVVAVRTGVAAVLHDAGFVEEPPSASSGSATGPAPVAGGSAGSAAISKGAEPAKPLPPAVQQSKTPAYNKSNDLVAGMKTVRVGGYDVPECFIRKLPYKDRKTGQMTYQDYVIHAGLIYLCDDNDLLYKDPRNTDPSVKADQLVAPIWTQQIKYSWDGTPGAAVARAFARLKDGRIVTAEGVATKDNTVLTGNLDMLSQTRAEARVLRKVLLMSEPSADEMQDGQVIDAKATVIEEASK